MDTTHTMRRLAGLALAGSLALSAAACSDEDGDGNELDEETEQIEDGVDSGIDELDQQIDEGAEEGEDGEG